MNKEEIITNLKNKKEDSYLIKGEASLVMQDLKKMTKDVVYQPIKDEKFVCVAGYNCESVDTYFERLAKSTNKKDKQILKELDLLLCLKDNKRYEKKIYQNGINLIAGVDEVGRGPLVGPVVAAAVILPKDLIIEGLTDSKKLSEKKREYYSDLIKKEALAYAIFSVDNEKIDEVNIYEATKIAMIKAITNLKIKPEHILIDAMPLDLPIPTTSIIKGDLKSQTIAAASVLAKVYRDHLLYELDKKYPMYNYRKNKGYPTKEHLALLKKYGITPYYRKSYGPVKEFLSSV